MNRVTNRLLLLITCKLAQLQLSSNLPTPQCSFFLVIIILNVSLNPISLFYFIQFLLPFYGTPNRFYFYDITFFLVHLFLFCDFPDYFLMTGLIIQNLMFNFHICKEKSVGKKTTYLC